MDNALTWHRPFTFAQFRALAWPKEHGSWSLALEPVALGLIAAPSAAGAWLAVAIVAGFFARRPLRTAWRESRPERRAEAARVLAACAVVATLALAAAITLAGFAWLMWLLPTAIAGAFFLSFDLRNAGREETAEIAGAAAFAALPVALAVLGGATPLTAVALGVVMCGRAVPTVLCVRTSLRAAKTGAGACGPAIVASVAALLAGAGLALHDAAPITAVIALTLLMLRTGALLVFPRPVLRARTIGMMEAILGVAFVIGVGATWTL